MSTDNPILPSAPDLPSTSSSIVATDPEVDSDISATNASGDLSKANTAKWPTNAATTYAFTGSDLGADSKQNTTGVESKGNSSEEGTTTDNKGCNKNDDGVKDEKNDESMFECNICLDTAKDAVVSLCGHLFCWPCLHQWLETRPSRKLCPVCKAAISKEKVIPLYGRNSSKQEDPRNKVPPRPAGQRTEPEPQQGFPGFGFGDGFYMSFGIGSFPFAYFTSSFNLWENRQTGANRGTTQYEDEQQLSKLFLYLAFLCIAWLLFA